jgi:hypothetical protein
MKDYYYLLGLKQTATLDDIKNSYRRLSKKFHPDVNDGDAFFAERFKDIQEAYEVLSNYEKRVPYDHILFSKQSGINENCNRKPAENDKKVSIELKQESLDFLASHHHPNLFDFRLKNNFGNNIAAEYTIQPNNGKIVVGIAYEYANDKTIIKLCGITSLIFVTNEAMCSKIKKAYSSIYFNQFNRIDSDWNCDVDLVDNHMEGIILSDLCGYAIVNGKISVPKSDSISEISLWSKALKTGMKSFFTDSLDRVEIPKWLYYIFLGCKTEFKLGKSFYTQKNFFGRCNKIQIKSDIV